MADIIDKGETLTKGVAQKSEDSEYGIYEFVKNHFSAFLGLGTIFITAITALMTFCGYLYEYTRLKCWNIDPAYINKNPENRLYTGIAILILIVAFVVLFLLAMQIAECSQELQKDRAYLRAVKRKYRANNFKNILWGKLPFLKSRSKEKNMKNLPAVKAQIDYLEDLIKKHRKK